MAILYISIDPGFDSLKVVANGKAFKIPFNVVETDERKMSDYALRDDFFLYRSSQGISYRVGQYAREMVFENKETMEEEMREFYTEQRFVGDKFVIGLDVAIATAIEKSNLYEDQKNLDIRLIVALPHSCRDKFASTIIGKASGTHTFSLRSGAGAEKSYSFHISSQKVKTVSQTIAAIIGETSDSYGNVDEKKAYYLTQGPTLVLDGGYYTFGMVAVSRGGSVDDTRTDSDTNHAMKNVNIKVAEAIADMRPDVKHYVIEYLLSKDNGMIRYMKDGKASKIDLNAIKTKAVTETCASFINHLNERYDNLLDFQYVLVTGGTGATFYKQMKEHYSQSGIMDDEHFLLADSTLDDEEFSIEFSIAIGAYKGLRGKE